MLIELSSILRLLPSRRSCGRMKKTVILCIFLFSNGGQIVAQSPSIFDLLYAYRQVKATLTIPLDSLQIDKFQEPRYKGHVTFLTGEDTILAIPVGVSPRGHFRLRECNFPPLAFDFNKEDLLQHDLDTADHYKLVTHCNDAQDTAQITAKEYLIYQLYHILTKKSYRVLWLDIVYVDKYSSKKITSQAFVIESNEEVADRHKGTWCEKEKIDIDSVDEVQFEIAALFQYMIGNRDMHLMSQHNVKVMKFSNGRKYMPIPYDFDFSLFVKPPYAYPGLRKRSNVRRIYLGYERNRRVFTRVVSRFLSNRDEILQYIANDQNISPREKQALADYISSFFNDLKKNEYQVTYRLK